MRRDSGDVFLIDVPAARMPWKAEWSPHGVVEVLEPWVADARRQRLLGVIERRIGSVTLLMDAPHDPHNGAAVLRSCDAFGLDTLHVVPQSEPFAAGRRVARGSECWVNVVVHDSPAQAIARLEANGFELVAAHPRGELLPQDLSTITRPCLVIGNEHDGISAALLSAARRSVQIPMRGFAESLNVSVAAAILLEAATRGRTGDLDDAARRTLYARGLYRSVNRAADVLSASRPR